MFRQCCQQQSGSRCGEKRREQRDDQVWGEAEEGLSTVCNFIGTFVASLLCTLSAKNKEFHCT